jgi:putative transposase
MSRFRLLPTHEQGEALLGHCRDARYVWNLAVEQQRHWQLARKAPGYVEQCAQLTEARAEYAWLRAGSQTVQQQALRDFAQAMRDFFSGTHRRPTWRKAGVHEGFRQVAVKPHHVERVNRHFGRGTVERPGMRVAQKRGLNRAIGRSGWGLLAARLQHKACGRVEQIPAAYTSQRCEPQLATPAA